MEAEGRMSAAYLGGLRNLPVLSRLRGHPARRLYMKAKRERSVTSILEDDALIDAGVRASVRDAIRRHQLLGIPIAVSRRASVDTQNRPMIDG
jgi:hypothetical protein